MTCMRKTCRMPAGVRRTRASQQTGSIESLSHQEVRVLTLVARGKTNKEIAAALRLRDATVKGYLSNIYQKLDVRRRTEAVAIYVRACI